MWTPRNSLLSWAGQTAVLTLMALAAFAAPASATADGFNLFEPNGNVEPLFETPEGVWWNEFTIDPSIQTDDPSINGIFISHDFMSCVDADTGKFISCTYTYSVKSLDDGSDPQIPIAGALSATDTYGGHVLHHASDSAHPQPFIYAPPIPQLYVLVNGGTVQSNSTDTSTGATDVAGATGNGVAELTFGQPEVAGATWVEATLTVPTNYFCVDGCFDTKVSIYHETMLRGVPGFSQLPTPTQGVDVYNILRDDVDAPPNGDPGHADSDATWGVPQTISQILGIAQKYHDLSPVSANIQVNDMSLPRGGLFDTHDDWNLNANGTFKVSHSHLDHRYGMAFDLNRTDTAGATIPCDVTDPQIYSLAGIVREQNFDYQGAGMPSQAIALVCESPVSGSGSKRIHINVYPPSPTLVQLLLDLPIPGEGLTP